MAHLTKIIVPFEGWFEHQLEDVRKVLDKLARTGGLTQVRFGRKLVSVYVAADEDKSYAVYVNENFGTRLGSIVTKHCQDCITKNHFTMGSIGPTRYKALKQFIRKVIPDVKVVKEATDVLEGEVDLSKMRV